MIIDLAKDERSDYLRDRTTHDILSIVTDKKAVSLKHVGAAVEKGDVVVLTKQGKFQPLIESGYVFNQLENNRRIAANEEQVMILPREYAKTGAQGRRMTVYGVTGFYLNLDSSAVVQAVIGNKGIRGPLSASMKEQLEWRPSRVYPAAFDVLGSDLEKMFKSELIGVRWHNIRDRRTVLLTPTRAIEALEGRVLQDFAYFRFGLPKLRKYLEEGMNGEGDILSQADVQSLQAKVERYEREIERTGLNDVLDRLDVTEKDMVDIEYLRENGLLSWCSVPSSDGKNRYDVHVWNMPVVKPGDKTGTSLPWDVSGYSTNPDRFYREGWALTGPGPGHFFLDKSFLLAVYSHQAKVNRNSRKFAGKRIGELPFFMPKPGAMRMYHNLKYRTLILDVDGKDVNLRPLTHAEMDIELMRHAAVNGFSKNYTTNVADFKPGENDPLVYAALMRR